MRQAEIIDVRRWSARLRDLLELARIFGTVAICTTVSIVMLVVISVGAERSGGGTMSPLQGMAMAVSAGFFDDMLEMEVPGYQAGSGGAKTFSPTGTAVFLLQMLTHVNPFEPRTLLAAELPGMRRDSTALLYGGGGTSPGHSPADFLPQADAIGPALSPPPTAASPSPEPSQQPPAGTGSGAAAGEGGQAADKDKVVFIYHSHNRESYLPELKSKGITNPDQAYDTEINVGLVGNRLKETLEAKGVGAAQANVDYPTEISGFNYAKSYAYSRGTVLEALAANPKSKLQLDIHRDSLARAKTTTTINGVDYAQIYFVIGKKNPHWEENSKLAEQLSALLDKKRPGLSKGVYGKSSHGNAEYNQSLSPHNLLVEIGGPDNSLEELYRTADVLAEAIAELLRDAEPVDAAPQR